MQIKLDLQNIINILNKMEDDDLNVIYHMINVILQERGYQHN
jgi:hypothetical protein